MLSPTGSVPSPGQPGLDAIPRWQGEQQDVTTSLVLRARCWFRDPPCGHGAGFQGHAAAMGAVGLFMVPQLL